MGESIRKCSTKESERLLLSLIHICVIGAGRKKHYDVVIRELTRFFIINGVDGCPVEDFNKDYILKFREFLRTDVYKRQG